MEDVAPGFINMLNGVCLVSFNKECIDLLLDEPGKFATLLLRYNEPGVVEFIVEKLILKPVLSDMGRGHDAGLLAKLFLEDPIEFKRTLEELLKHFFQKPC
ncbi:MAG: hypothetical protein QXP02_03450 [Desulfurococcaceae archaeon]